MLRDMSRPLGLFDEVFTLFPRIVLPARFISVAVTPRWFERLLTKVMKLGSEAQLVNRAN